MATDAELRAIVSGLREAVVVVDEAGTIVEWLGGAGRMFGWSAEEAVGRSLDDLLDARDSAGRRTCVGRIGRDRRLASIAGTPESELLTTTRHGKRRWVGVTSTFERGADGAIVRTTAVLRDIGRRKRVDIAKSDVISAVAHELRSPLTSVKGFAATLLHRWDRFDDDQKKQLLATINTDADRVTRLIGELLDVSRLEAGRMTLVRRPIGLDEVASRVVDRIRPRSEGHQISCEFPPDLPPVFADSDKIEQVFTNLVENAVKYTAGGRVMVRGTRQGSDVLITVSDEGEGIAPEHRFQVFQKFFRAGPRSRSPGTGLGLYISKGLVEAHGGRIWVDNGAGKGAVFTFTLPVSVEET